MFYVIFPFSEGSIDLRQRSGLRFGSYSWAWRTQVDLVTRKKQVQITFKRDRYIL